MERLSELNRRIESLTELLEVIGTMRSLAATRVREARTAVPGIRQYATVVDEALAEAVPLLAGEDVEPGPESDGTAVLVFSSEHGFVGAFNDHLLDAAGAALRRPNDRLLIVGARGLVVAEERRHPVAWSHGMATSTAGVTAIAQSAVDELYRGLGGGEFSRVTLYYAHSASGATWQVAERQLLPFDPTPYQMSGRASYPPLINLEPNVLLEMLVNEFVFAELMHAAMESFASENIARLMAMEAAHKNIEDRLEESKQKAWQRRQEEITMELLDVVTGAEAMTNSVQDD
jgi:F-type H+-transporting ATPase subunit gamma